MRVTNPVLNALGYVLELVFRKSHDHVVRDGEAGLRVYCAAGRAHAPPSRADPPYRMRMEAITVVPGIA